MFKKILGSLVVLGLVISTSWAAEIQESGTSTGKAQSIEIKTVMEYKLPEGEEIVDVIFDEVTVTVKEAMTLEMRGLEKKEVTEKVSVRYPKVLVAKNSVQTLDEEGGRLNERGRVKFLDERGKVKREEVLAPYGGSILSKKGNYIGITKGVNVTEKGHDYIEFKLMNEDGEILWKSNEVCGEDVQVYVSDKGNVIGVDLWEGGKLWFYDSQGTLLKKVDPQVNLICSDQEISEDGRYFVVSSGENIVLFDINGNEIWRKIMKGFRSKDVGISPNGAYIVAFMSNEKNFVYLFDLNGNLLLKQEVGYVGRYDVSFSPDETHCAIYSSENELYFLQTKPSKLLWKYNDATRWFTSVALSRNGEFILGRVVKYIDSYYYPSIYLMNKSGKVLWQKEAEEAKYRIEHGETGPKILLNPEGTDIYFTLPKKIIHLKNEFAK